MLLQTAVGQPQAEEDGREKHKWKQTPVGTRGRGCTPRLCSTCTIYNFGGSSFRSCVKLPGKEGCWSCPWMLPFPSHPQAGACAYKRSGNLAGWERGAQSRVGAAPVLLHGNHTKKVPEPGQRAAFSLEPPAASLTAEQAPVGSSQGWAPQSGQSAAQPSSGTEHGHSRCPKMSKFPGVGRDTPCRHQLQPFIRLEIRCL